MDRQLKLILSYQPSSFHQIWCWKYYQNYY